MRELLSFLETFGAGQYDEEDVKRLIADVEYCERAAERAKTCGDHKWESVYAEEAQELRMLIADIKLRLRKGVKK